MAYTPSHWGVGAPGSASTTDFAPQPQSYFPLLTDRRGQNDGGQYINGKDGWRLNWGFGQRGSLSHAEFRALITAWDTHAKPNAGTVDLRGYDIVSNSWVILKAIMMYPMSEPQGTDGTGPRHFNVELVFKSWGMP